MPLTDRLTNYSLKQLGKVLLGKVIIEKKLGLA